MSVKPPHILITFRKGVALEWEYSHRWRDDVEQVYEGKYPRYVFRVKPMGGWLYMRQ